MVRLFPELAGFTASIDEIRFLPELASPESSPYGFLYVITISNDSGRRLRIEHRKWIVKCLADRHVEIVEGDGVVGQFPLLEPGEQFSYNSRHFVREDSDVQGTYFAVDDSGTHYGCRLPVMELRVPPWAKDTPF